MSQDKYDVILIDGRHLLYRTAYKLAMLGADIEGERVPTGGIYGFVKSILGIHEDYAHDSTHVIVCWDAGYDHRKELYPGYKASRKTRTYPDNVKAYLETLDAQERVLRGLLRVFGWYQAVTPGMEADDTMGTLATKYGADPTSMVAIYTADQDLLQLVTDNVHMVAPPVGNGRQEKTGDKIWTTAEVTERWMSPEGVVHMKALCGDSGDNIPGCPGVGEVWARKLLTQWPTCWAVIEAAADAARENKPLSGRYDGQDWVGKAVTKNINQGADLIRTSYKLAWIVRNAPVNIIEPARNPELMERVIRKYQMISLVAPSIMDRIEKIAISGLPDSSM